MVSYEINQSKRKKAMKQVVKANIKTTKKSVKFCYGLTWFLRILAIILGAGNILYVALISKDALDLIFIIVTLGFTFGLSFLPATVYIIAAGGEYRLRRKETITLTDDGFIYSFRDGRTGLTDTVFALTVVYENISNYEYNEKTKLLTLRGKILGDTYENEQLKSSEEFAEISFLDIYDIGVKQMLDDKCIS